MNQRVAIKTPNGFIKGWIESKPNGDKILTNFNGFILGRYVKKDDTTRTFNGEIVAYGDFLTALLDRE